MPIVEVSRHIKDLEDLLGVSFQVFRTPLRPKPHLPTVGDP